MRRTAAVVSASALLALTACGADEPGDDGEASPPLVVALDLLRGSRAHHRRARVPAPRARGHG
ncbi:hypothetical protein [Nocardioides zeae]